MCLMSFIYSFFFFNDTATTEIYTLSLHDALPISERHARPRQSGQGPPVPAVERHDPLVVDHDERRVGRGGRSEEHTSELQSRLHLVCRLLLEKKKSKTRLPASLQSNLHTHVV